MKRLRTFSAAALVAALAFAAAPTFAKDHGNGHGNGEGHGKGQEKQEQRAEGRGEHKEVRPGAYFNDQHREQAHRYYAEHYANAKHCPPGLAKKNNGCMPPGQARKWSVGEPLPSGVTLYSVPQPLLVQLPPAPIGYRYSRAGGDIVLIRVNGNVVVDIMLNVFG